MTTFAKAIKNNQTARTLNNMKAEKNTGDACVDLFFKIGAMRGQDVVPAFVTAYTQDRNLALRVALWARDVRGGAGERKAFRDILAWLEKNDKDAALAFINKTPELGRWDDILQVTENDVKLHAFNKVKEALEAKNGLAAKWMPRKGPLSVELREFLGWSPKRYRKTLVNLTKVVEQQMCSKQWNEINFNHVPSIAMKKYRKAFKRNSKTFVEWVQAVKTGGTFQGEKAKVNAKAIFPHDVIADYIDGRAFDSDVQDSMVNQWNALPNYIQDGNVLPLVDVSGSMTSRVSGNISALCIAVSLGLYCADKNKGKFNGAFLTFSGSPELLHLEGTITQKIDQMTRSTWEMNTNLHAAFETILDTAKNGNVPQSEMPTTLLILSDMQFDQCVKYDDSAIQMIRRKYEKAGYVMPNVVFWNINSYDNAPVKFNTSGTALVSGFSPSILKAVLSNDMEAFTPRGVMLKTVMASRYDF